MYVFCAVSDTHGEMVGGDADEEDTEIEEVEYERVESDGAVNAESTGTGYRFSSKEPDCKGAVVKVSVQTS